jgi:hypothetical protein
MDLTIKKSSLAFLIKLTTGTLTVSVNILLVKLKQIKTRPAKTRLVKGLKGEGSIESEVASKSSKVGQIPNRTVQSFFGSAL